MSNTLNDKWSVLMHTLGGFSIYKYVNGQYLQGLLFYKNVKEAQDHCDKLNA